MRKYQKEILELCDQKLKDGEKELHIVAPPGAGKTIIGLQIFAQFKCPSLVLCPNSTIASQWGQKLDLFLSEDWGEEAKGSILGTHLDRPLKPLTVLTYQKLSVPGREHEYLKEMAKKEWIQELVEQRGLSITEAESRIQELLTSNKTAHSKEISRHLKNLRKNLAEVLELEQVLHANAIELMNELRQQGCKLVIFDECHHLTDYWSVVMTKFVHSLDEVTIVGLTGTPPDDNVSAKQKNRYLNLVGDIDYQVPTPALVKEGGLAPFQDLVYFTRPSDSEREFLQRQHEELHRLLTDLSPSSEAPTRLSQFVSDRVWNVSQESWTDWVEANPILSMAMCRYLWTHKLQMPQQLELSESVRQAPLLDDWIKLLEDFTLNELKLSELNSDKELYDQISNAVRKVGFSISERGIRKVSSPVDRVLAYSENKAQAVCSVLEQEYGGLDDRLRAILVTDFETMSATAARSVKDVMDKEAGGAIGAFKTLLAHKIGEMVNPCLVTGSVILVDKRIARQTVDAFRTLLSERDSTLALAVEESEGELFSAITAKSQQWTTRLYVELVTKIFERGISKCLVGTRGIFGEGWDSQSLNTVIDLTTTTSSTSVKQLRGRGIRLNTTDPIDERKVANNWDIVCVAPEFEKGMNDYQRFVRKHKGYFGISDDGQIECGVGHVHPAFSEMTPVDVFASIDELNTEMLKRALCRDQIYELWRVGESYSNRQLGCVEVSRMREIGKTPPSVGSSKSYVEHAQSMRSALSSLPVRYGGIGVALSALSLTVIWTALQGLTGWFAMIPLIVSLICWRIKRGQLRQQFLLALKDDSTESESLTSIATAVMVALRDRGFISPTTQAKSIRVSVRSDKSYRIFLDDTEAEHSRIFVQSVEETLAPITNQPYILPKYEYRLETLASGDNSALDKYMNGLTPPEIASYHAVPKLLARSAAGREAFVEAWNEFVSPGFLVEAQSNPEILQKYFGMGPSLAERMLWD